MDNMRGLGAMADLDINKKGVEFLMVVFSLVVVFVK